MKVQNNKMYRFVVLLFICTLLVIALTSCGSSETIIKPKTIDVVIPETKTEMEAVIETPEVFIEVESDSIKKEIETFIEKLPDDIKVTGEADYPLSKGKIKAIYHPKKKKIEIIVPEQTKQESYLDTTKITKNISTAEKIGYGFYGIAIAGFFIIVGIIVYILKRKGIIKL